MAASAPKPNLLVSFATDMSETSIATELGKALDETVVSFQDIATGRTPIPSTQTRLTFYGHGDIDVFGSNRTYFNPTQFAAELIKILTTNPGIKDIDLLSCNVGLIDDKGQSYVTQVQDILNKAGFKVNINTFLVDNSKKDVHESLFVVGVDNAYGPSLRQEIASRGVDLVGADEFSLDILRTNNERLMKVSADIQIIKEKIAFEDALTGLFSAMKSCCSDRTYTEDALKEEMRRHFSEPTINRLLGMYHVEYFAGNDDEDGYFKCDLPPARQRAEYTGKYTAIREGKYTYSGEVREAQNLTPDESMRLNVRLSELSCLFSELRAREGRVFKDKLSNIRSYLKPAPVLALTVAPVLHAPSTAGIHGALLAASVEKSTATVESIIESIKSASKLSMVEAVSDVPVMAPPSSELHTSPSAHPVEEASQKNAADKSDDKKPEHEPSEFRPG